MKRPFRPSVSTRRACRFPAAPIEAARTADGEALEFGRRRAAGPAGASPAQLGESGAIGVCLLLDWAAEGDDRTRRRRRDRRRPGASRRGTAARASRWRSGSTMRGAFSQTAISSRFAFPRGARALVPPICLRIATQAVPGMRQNERKGEGVAAVRRQRRRSAPAAEFAAAEFRRHSGPSVRRSRRRDGSRRQSRQRGGSLHRAAKPPPSGRSAGDSPAAAIDDRAAAPSIAVSGIP